MKSIKILFLSVSLLSLLSACYDDKGNYDYKDYTKLEIVSKDSYSIGIGEILKITPEITYSKENPKMNLSYSWVLEGDEISTDPVLEWVTDRYTKENSDNLILTITDHDTELVYIQSYTVRVREKYAGHGFYLLSKRDGKVCVHMIKEGTDEEGKLTFSTLENIYSLENAEDLPATTFKLHEHYSLNKGSSFTEINNQLMFVGKDQTVEVQPGTFQKVEYTLPDMFGGALPGGLSEVSDVYFMQFLDMIKDGEGRIYTRIKTTNELFHIDQFLPQPLKFEREELNNIEFIPSHLSSQHCMLYDKKERRLLLIWDFKAYGEKYTLGKVEKVTSSWATNKQWPDTIPTIEEAFEKYDVLHMATYKTDFGMWEDGLKTHYFSVLRDPTNGKIYHYKFCLEQLYDEATMKIGTVVNDGEDVLDVEFRELTGKAAELFGNPQNKIYTFGTNYLAYGYYGYLTLIAQGNTLYVYDRAVLASDSTNPKNPRVLCTFDADIALMVGLTGTTYWGRDMGVALKDGSFEVLSLENAQYSTWDGRLWKTKDVNLGEPIDVFYTLGDPGGMNNWN